MKQTITRAAFAALVRERKGAVIAAFDTLTDARPRKTGNPFASIQKLSTFGAVVNASYENAVNKGLAQSVNPQVSKFKAKARQWGEKEERADGSVSSVVEKDGKFYLSLVLSADARRAFPSAVTYLADGKPVEKEAVAAWLPAPRPTATQSDAGVDEEKQAIQRDFSFSSILRVRMDGKEYVLTD